jgi:NAD-dependent dihydropyrimidine dehydrogenase PreA subunit
MIQINQELCSGCGVCVEACSTGAIYLVDHRAEVDNTLCTQCEACLEACPNGVITSISEPVLSAPIVALPVAETQIDPTPIHIELPETTAPNRSLVPLAGAALSFLGREVAPRLLDVLATTLEHRLTTSATSTTTSLSASPKRSTRTNRGIRRQIRYRGGRTIRENYQERR